MLKWMRENISVAAAIGAGLLWICGAVVHAYMVKADVEFSIEKAESAQDRLLQADKMMDQRVKAVEVAQQEQTVQLTQIQTQQTGLIKTTDKMDKKLERVDDKLDQLLTR